MRSILALATFVLATSAIGCEIQPSELSVGGVVSGATEASVTRLLGEPAERAETGEGIELRYPELVATVAYLEQAAPGVQRRVVALRGTGARACTPRGLCPGMPASEATRIYGPSTPVRRESGTFFEFQPEGLACWLQVAATGGIVESVAVACQP
jgi:hypothetical protein